VVKTFVIRSRARYDANLSYSPLRVMRLYSNRIGGEIDVQLCDEEASARFGYGTEICVEIPFFSPQVQLDLMSSQTFDVFDEGLQTAVQFFRQAMEDVYSPQALLPLRSQAPRQGSRCKIPKEAQLEEESEKLPKETPSPEDFLQEVFGDFCVFLKQQTLKPETRRATLVGAFSCWNEEYCLLIKYRHVDLQRSSIQTVMSSESVHVFYKGIEIQNYNAEFCRAVRVPFWDVELHLYADHANQWLAVNREYILEEKVAVLARMAQETHLGLLRFLFSKEAESYVTELKQVWEPEGSEDLREYYTFARHYSAHSVLLLNETPQARAVLQEASTKKADFRKDAIPCYSYEIGSLWLRYREDIRPQLVETVLYQSVTRQVDTKPFAWFIDRRALSGLDYDIDNGAVANAGDTNPNASMILIPHLYYSWDVFAAKNFMLLRLKRHAPVCCLQLGKRGGKIVQASNTEDYWDYVGSILQRSKEDDRPVFPSNEALKGNITVKVLPPSLGLPEVRVFDSWVLSPLSCGELMKLLEKSKKMPPDQLNQLISDVFPEEWLDSHQMLLKFIRLHALSGAKNRDTAKEMSRKEQCEIYASYVIFLKKLLKHVHLP
jgi:hypothetical protein